MNKIPIVFAFDNNLVMPACVCISSLLMNAGKDTFYNIFILHSSKVDLKKEELDKLPLYYNNCKITYRSVGEYFDSSFEIRGITVCTYYRLLIPELIPEYDKVLYSDVDVIFRSDLSEIYNTDMTGYYVGGVNSMCNYIPDLDRYYKQMSVDSSKNIYAGNLLINSKALLADGIVAKFKEMAHRQYKFQDMDIINIVCAGKIKYLPPLFCLTTYISEFVVREREKLLNIWTHQEIEEALKTGIVHYNGQKPWKGACINFDIWWEYYRRSPFFDQVFYFEFFNYQLNLLDHLTLWKRIKVLIRYFTVGKLN